MKKISSYARAALKYVGLPLAGAAAIGGAGYGISQIPFVQRRGREVRDAGDVIKDVIKDVGTSVDRWSQPIQRQGTVDTVRRMAKGNNVDTLPMAPAQRKWLKERYLFNPDETYM